MNSGIRIIKREQVGLPLPPPARGEKSGRQNEREIASTVKNWIAELAQRQSTDKQVACNRFFAIH